MEDRQLKPLEAPEPGQPAGAAAGYLDSVAAVSSGDLWVVGWSQTGSTESTLVEHSAGPAWRIVASANP